ncbi:hypothetical protein MRY87_11825 [bacterium]|nr:hypothetical protein [bacterium]
MKVFFVRLLFTLFTLRCVAQLMQYALEFTWLPPFSRFQSGSIPYPLLLSLQVVILSLGWPLSLRIKQRTTPLSPKIIRWIRPLGVVYLLFSVIRLFLGTCIYTEHSFWAAHIPSIFHLMLATWLLLVTHGQETE